MAVKPAMSALPLDRPLRVLGFMTGTSLDAVDMAVLETDGARLLGFGPAGERKLEIAERAVLERATADALAWPWDAPAPKSFAAAAAVVAQLHLSAARDFLAEHGLGAGDLDLVGFHGQTVLHQPKRQDGRPGRTVQLGDAQALADGLGLPVAYDFRSADVAAGGQGAPLAPIYHQLRAAASGLEPPVAALNLGGVANITLIRSDGTLQAFDTGPANGMIDLLVQVRTGARFDADGALARAGRVDAAVLERLLGHPYFRATGPKSLDRYDFDLAAVDALSLEDAAASLTAFAAEAAARGIAACAEPPRVVIACGGGRHNPVLLGEIARRSGAEVVAAEAVGWRGDSIEAEAFALLAARTARGLPISFPGTTGVQQAMTGGRIVHPR